ncbi:MAG: bestrophin family ion channel [Candidatus Obscuribacterales bacterium]
MYVRSSIRPSIILWFCWRHLVFFTLYSAAAVYAFEVLDWKFAAIPFLPVGTIGTAVAFYVGFKNNASYERLWEGRKIWGSITNLSRAFGALVLALGPNKPIESKLQHRLIHRQIAWCNTLKLSLRSYPAHRNAHKTSTEVALIESIFKEKFDRETLAQYLERSITAEDKLHMDGSSNPALSLLQLQLRDIEELANLSDTHSSVCEKMTDTMIECIKEQGACERLKNFPFPRQYAYFSEVFVWIFLLLLPFGLIDELSKATNTGLTLLVVPFSVLISWMFITMEQVGDSSEDPFELALNDVPLSAICRTIEIELLQMIGETNLPEPILPVADILL